MMRNLSSNTPSTRSTPLYAALANQHPFAHMFAKLTDLLFDSKTEIAELLQEIHWLQDVLKERLRERKHRFEHEL